VLRLPGVGSKRFLTTKVDRSVTGLIAQQQCCGPLQLPVSDVAVMAQSHFGHTGSATSIGEQPLKVGRWMLLGTAGKPAALPPRLPSACPCPSARAWVPPKPGLPAVPATPHIPSLYLPPPPLLQGLIDPKAMARLALGEALTNLVFARVTALRDIKASGEPAPELPLPVPAPAACLHAWRLRVCYMPPHPALPACPAQPTAPALPACLPAHPSLPPLYCHRTACVLPCTAAVNWMYAAKMDSEGAAMYDAAVALRDAMIELEVAVDGGKDSLSMAAAAGGCMGVGFGGCGCGGGGAGC
jgi:hypothetical protein